jgi:hypothetical protein
MIRPSGTPASCKALSTAAIIGLGPQRPGHPRALDRGHFLPEERPEETARERLAFFAS